MPESGLTVVVPQGRREFTVQVCRPCGTSVSLPVPGTTAPGFHISLLRSWCEDVTPGHRIEKKFVFVRTRRIQVCG